MNIYGKEMEKQELLKHVGSIKQIMGAREAVYRGGMQEGVKAVEVYNDTGLSFAVLPDKGMDIGYAAYRGRALAMVCKNGVVGPQYFENGGQGFFRSFSGGLLTTCGLLNVGEAQTDGGIAYGLHDRIGNTPAEQYSTEAYWDESGYCVRVRGTVRQSSLYYENLTMTREITCRMGEPALEVRDVLCNEGFAETPFMFMYHMNFGYPLLCADTRLYSPAERVWNLDGRKPAKKEEYACFHSPEHGAAYHCYAHDMPAGKKTTVALVNHGLELGVALAYDSGELPTFNTWKMMGEQDYVLGLEPGINLPEGRIEARKNGRLRVLKPGETYTCGVRITILDGRREIDDFLREFNEDGGK